MPTMALFFILDMWRARVVCDESFMEAFWRSEWLRVYLVSTESGHLVMPIDNLHPLQAGEAWVCPGGQCAEIGADGQLIVLPPAATDRYVPSVDRLFESAARHLRQRCLGVVLTGMGDDGARGAAALHRAGARVLAESAETAVIYGMPQAAAATGAVDESLPIDALGRRLGQLLD